MSEIEPINYKIRLEPDLEQFRFEGSAKILMETAKPAKKISLNGIDLAIWRCQAKMDGEYEACPFSVDPTKETIELLLPKEMSGTIEIKIDYIGEINNKMAGFYRSRYLLDGKEKHIAVTQFEESDARRAIPCFDHPARKATFDVQMVINEDLSAISNGPIVKENSLGNGKKLVEFEQTPKMSTYLLFFGVGEFEFIEDPGEVLVRLAAMPGMTKYGTYGLAFSRKALEYSEDYYGVPYPLRKLDVIAIEDFAAGAMENWGAVTFRENLLLHHPGITSKAGEERICEVIAHEIAHQWFGNLVTPSDWKYLWLNESFATYFGYGVVDNYYPEWDQWHQFLHSQTETSLERDGMLETFPIEIPGGEHVVINVSTAPIIYNKGASILRQVEGYVGKDNFKKGLRHYLKKHEYGCASSHHLWEALEEVSKKPVSAMMKSWVEQPGFPIVEVKREDNNLVLSQKRFSYLPNDTEQTWHIPVTIQIFSGNRETRTSTTMIDSGTATIEIGPDVKAYKVNHGHRGFFRTLYGDQDNLYELGKKIAGKELCVEDRWGLQDDLYALVKRGDITVDHYFDFLSNYSNEDAFLPLMSIAGNLFHAYLVSGENKRAHIASVGRSLFESVLKDIGFEPLEDEKHTTSILRDQLLKHATLYGSSEIRDFALSKFSSLFEGGEVHPDIMRSVMQIGALNGDQKTFDWFDKKFRSSESEHERMNILVALGWFQEENMIEKAQKYVLDNVPSRNKFITVGSLSANPRAMPMMWDWYINHLKEFEQFHPVHYERVIAAVVPLGGLGREKEVKAFFLDYVKRNEKLKDVVNLSLERLEVNSRIPE